MDTLRAPFDSEPASEDTLGLSGSDDLGGYDGHDSAHVATTYPVDTIKQDERRMQVRAYNHWASLLGDGSFPSIEGLEPAELTDFGPNSVLLDFSSGTEDPVVQYLGASLAEECTGNDAADGAGGGDGSSGAIERLSDVPPRSLLSRITDHYLQIIANQAPIGFEAEFVNSQGAAVLYRGILLPFSSDGETIDFVFGVINWKTMADAAQADELLLEIDSALNDDDNPGDPAEGSPIVTPAIHRADPVTDWADSPAHETDESFPQREDDPASAADGDLPGERDPGGELPGESNRPSNVTPFIRAHGPSAGSGGAAPDFDHYALDDEGDDEGDEPGDADDYDALGAGGANGGSGTRRADAAAYSFASLADYIEAPSKKAIDLDAERFDPGDYRVDDAGPAHEAATPEDGDGGSETTPARGPAPGPAPAPPPAPLPPLPRPLPSTHRRTPTMRR